MKRRIGGKILVGTASWADPGFVESWYPKRLPASERLPWYAEHFNLVEVNSTFYRVPEPDTVKRWCEQTPDGFVFDVKLHRLLSRHSTKPELLSPGLRAKAVINKGKVKLNARIEKAVVRSFLKGIEPLRSAGKLGALLLQFSPAFSPRHNQLRDLDSLLELLQGFEVAIELRNRGWVSPELLPETRRFFAGRKVAFVMVDGPEDEHFMVMPNLDLVTSSRLAYLRAHGRNARGYVRGRSVPARFDYDYARNELKEIAGRAAKAATQAKAVHVVYNNNKADYAPRAAASFQEILREEYPEMVRHEVLEANASYA